MALREEMRRGKSVWVIDIRYRDSNGKRARFRRDSKAATKTAAREEDRRIRDRLAKTGSPYEPEEPQSDDELDEGKGAQSAPTFGEVVESFCSSYMVTDLKPTTRHGYKLVLDGILLPRFQAKPITEIDGSAAAQLDVELVKNGGSRKKKLSRGTRNNIQIVLRSVLRFAHERGFMGNKANGLPRLKRLEQSILEIPRDDEVQLILASASESQHLCFALMAYAGLRPNEVRGLRRRDVQLRREGEEAVGGFLSIREGRSRGVEHTPKTGVREIPIAPPLARALARVVEGPRDGLVALTEQGEPWGQHGLDQAFKRVRDRVGFAGWSVYTLRHYAITSWLRAGIPVHVVQKMAGHKHLSTTQRYVHFLKEDLEEAARRLSRMGNSGETPPGTKPPKPGSGV